MAYPQRKYYTPPVTHLIIRGCTSEGSCHPSLGPRGGKGFTFLLLFFFFLTFGFSFEKSKGKRNKDGSLKFKPLGCKPLNHPRPSAVLESLLKRGFGNLRKKS